MKASRYITHNRKLKDPQNGIERFLPLIDKLGRRLGPILFQLPPAWNVNVERLDEFLSCLPRGHRYAFEFRNSTWNVAEVYQVLDRHNAAYCIYELAGFLSPIQITADFTYVRLHGPGNKYQGGYSEQTPAAGQRGLDAGGNSFATSSFISTTTRPGSRRRMHCS